MLLVSGSRNLTCPARFRYSETVNMRSLELQLRSGALAGLLSLCGLGCGGDPLLLGHREPASDGRRELADDERLREASRAPGTTRAETVPSADVDPAPSVTVASVPRAEVYVLDALVGNTPLELPTGAPLDLRLRAPGYLDQDVRIDERTPARREVRLLPDPAASFRASPVPVAAPSQPVHECW